MMIMMTMMMTLMMMMMPALTSTPRGSPSMSAPATHWAARPAHVENPACTPRAPSKQGHWKSEHIHSLTQQSSMARPQGRMSPSQRRGTADTYLTEGPVS
jgi:hypothetical protein